MYTCVVDKKLKLIRKQILTLTHTILSNRLESAYANFHIFLFYFRTSLYSHIRICISHIYARAKRMHFYNNDDMDVWMTQKGILVFLHPWKYLALFSIHHTPILNLKCNDVYTKQMNAMQICDGVGDKCIWCSEKRV